VIMSVNRTPTPGGAPGIALLERIQKSVPITDTIAVQIASSKAPHQGTSLGGGAVGGADTVGGGGILLLLDT